MDKQIVVPAGNSFLILAHFQEMKCRRKEQLDEGVAAKRPHKHQQMLFSVLVSSGDVARCKKTLISVQ